MNKEEKRKLRRFYYTLDVEFDISTHQQWIVSSAKNFSMEGMCLLTKEHIPMNSLLLIKFNIPESNKMIQLTGEVVWNSDHMMSGEQYYENGIKFIEIMSQYKELIEDYLKEATF
ncbi:MAG: PilZ domain-containing protein [Spirochaetales bacterium]|nr:PilZ domain-containing protein [Spirochaetales bacterium]